MRSYRSSSKQLGLLLVAASILLLATVVTAQPSSSSLIPDADSIALSTNKHARKHHDGTHKKQLRDEWSSIMGWVSIACWVLPSFSQMHQNYISKSAEGLSITFVVIWLAGDALNAAGAWFQGLLWTMIILALYYCACDCVLIFQYWYYRKYYHRGVRISTISASLEANERTPLIGDGNVLEDHLSTKSGDDDDDSSIRTQIVMYTLAALLVVATGVATWWVAEHHYGSDDDVAQPAPAPEPVGWRWDAQVAGWLSALLYLSSRVPQILKNRTTKCEGLSLALFVFAVAGNLTYVASILLKSTRRDYLIESFSWLVGSLGTVFLDFIVLGQFIHYRKARKEIHRLRRSSIAQQQRPRVQPPATSA
ncbi:conserved hypothetical protein [Sporisorium reilianum SRZ2]|uniref:Uncharacterized protein n=1 Tax=Sporisorium reilianum (strain SRZ2) TaxID=999809 RepID=E6ZVW9_SPORE|nr:conserved hypothetical protein [Sporisorium reilianum SRZ2]